VADLLISLVEKSLVVFDEERGRYRLLETVRAYGRALLADNDEADGIRNRHLEHFLALSEEAEPRLTGADQLSWLDRLEAEHDNVRAALAWSSDGGGEGGLRLAAAIWRFWEVRGHLGEGRAWFATLLPSATREAGQDGGPPLRAKALNGAGMLAYRQGDHAIARPQHTEALAIRRELGDRPGIAISLNNLGLVAQAQEEHATARGLFEESLAIRRELGDRWGVAAGLGNLGIVAHDLGDYAAARALHDGSLAIWRELGDTRCIAMSLSNLGDAASEQGDHLVATLVQEEALVIRRKLGDRWGVAISLEALAPVGVACGRADKSARLWGAAERLREEIGTPLPPNERVRYEQKVAAARAALGDAAFERAWQEGRAMTMEEAVDYTLAPA
jgi:non-specific serine/threonine protein kinase